jgi:hypothetical protein
MWQSSHIRALLMDSVFLFHFLSAANREKEEEKEE